MADVVGLCHLAVPTYEALLIPKQVRQVDKFGNPTQVVFFVVSNLICDGEVDCIWCNKTLILAVLDAYKDLLSVCSEKFDC
jgi:hypothetical protein